MHKSATSATTSGVGCSCLLSNVFSLSIFLPPTLLSYFFAHHHHSTHNTTNEPTHHDATHHSPHVCVCVSVCVCIPYDRTWRWWSTLRAHSACRRSCGSAAGTV